MIKSIKVQISKRRTLELTLDQARTLYQELGHFFGPLVRQGQPLHLGEGKELHVVDDYGTEVK